MLYSFSRIWGSEMARIAEFLKLSVVLSALLASAGAAAAQAGEPSRGNCATLAKAVAAIQLRGKILDAHFQGNRYVIKYLGENGRVSLMKIHVRAVGGEASCIRGRWRIAAPQPHLFPPDIVLPEP